MLAGQFWTGRAQCLSSRSVMNDLPGLRSEGLRGGVRYIDGQFDDSRLAISLARTAVQHGAVVVNYMKVERLQCTGGIVNGVVARDVIGSREYSISARSVINATGVFAEHVLGLEEQCAVDQPPRKSHPPAPTVRPSQGTHLVLDASFLPGDRALMIPETDDGRVLFAIPWHGRVLLGTTDVAVPHVSIEPRAMSEEVDYLLRYAARYLNKAPSVQDIRSCFSGLRPLVGSRSNATATSKLSREHEIYVGPTGMITVIGGKWTTYRHMGEELIDHAERSANLPRRPSRTSELALLGAQSDRIATRGFEHLSVYGSDADAILKSPRVPDDSVAKAFPNASDRLHSRLPYLCNEVVWAARHEMAMTVEDVLARRTRSLFLDAQAAQEAAPKVASILKAELGKDAEWEAREIASFTELANGYVP